MPPIESHMQAIEEQLEEQLKVHEGLRLRVYRDICGNPIIGYGHLVTKREKLKAICRAEAERLLKRDLEKAVQAAETYPWFSRLSVNRQAVVVDMIFNMGKGKFNRFKSTQAAIGAGRYSDAAKAMRGSKWARQTGIRARTLSIMMANDVDFQTARRYAK